MKLASIQMSVVEGDKRATVNKALDHVGRCTGADLVLLPEIWNIGFMSFDSYIGEAEEERGALLSTLQEAAVGIGAYLHTGSWVEKRGEKYLNSSYLLGPDGEVLGSYRKIHLFGYNSKEAQILSPGEEVVVIETPLARIGMATCYDLRFPEMFRRMVELGAELFLVCSAWPYPRLEHWLMLNRVRAMENQCFLISANSVGLNRGSRYVGHSMVVDPWGTVIAGAGDLEAIVKADIDLETLREARRQFPALADRKEWLQAPRA
jgi:predicted amidohydrolase